MYYDDYYKYDNRIDLLNQARYNYCGLDTRNVKLLLNKLSENDDIAEAYRIALEIEDCNIKAKKYYGSYMLDYYDLKDQYIKDLAKVCNRNKWVYGWLKSDAINIPYLVYFELPDCEQISFHSKTNFSYMPKYKGEWDKKEDATLNKIEHAITQHFYKELSERKHRLDSTKEKREATNKKLREKRYKEWLIKEAEREKREEEQRIQWEQERINRRLDSYSTDKMIRRYDEFISVLSKRENAGLYVKIKYCNDGVFVSEDAVNKPFNLFVWSAEDLTLYEKRGHTNPKYYDEFIQIYKICENKENYNKINIYKNEYLQEYEEKQQQKKQALKDKNKELLLKENEILKPWLSKNKGITKTLYKSICNQIKLLYSTLNIMCIADDNGMFYKINNDNSRTYFNVLLTDKHLTKWDKKKDNTGYIKINKLDVYCSATDLKI